MGNPLKMKVEKIARDNLNYRGVNNAGSSAWTPART